MPKKKYLIIPGKIMSQTDKDIHFISTEQLLRLYDVDRNECIMVQLDHQGLPIIEGIDVDQYTILGPRYDGKYEIPKIHQ